MTKEEVVTLMQSSNTELEWNENCDKVKKECGGYPSFWYSTIILSGLGDKTAAKWGDDMYIRVKAIRFGS